MPTKYNNNKYHMPQMNLGVTNTTENNNVNSND